MDNNSELQAVSGDIGVTELSDEISDIRSRLKTASSKLAEALEATEEPLNLKSHVARLRNYLKERLRRNARGRVLVTYDGSIFDQLCLDLVIGTVSTVDVICHTRPCMDLALQKQVLMFSKENSYPIVRTADACEINYRTLEVESHGCYAVTKKITEYMASHDALFVSSSGFSQNCASSSDDFASGLPNACIEINENTGDVIWTINEGGIEWSSLLLLHGLMPYEVVAYHQAFISTELLTAHVPQCFFPYYHEIESMYVKTLISTSLSQISSELTE
ncbi:MAG: hypothetical protein AAF662_00010 [Pseudomonadota bacterium]